MPVIEERDKQAGHELFKRFANKSIEAPASTVWSKDPPGIDEFITSKDYLGQLPLSRRQAEALHAILGKDPKRTFEDTQLPLESILLYGKGSGKDLISSYLIAYLCYLVLLLIDPHTYFGLAHGENIDIVNVATNAQQSRQVFFSKLKARLGSRCFKEFGPVPGATMYRFPHINLRLHSVHAANESWEGLNILAWVMDEASAFRAAGGMQDNSGAVYQTCRTSANSRFASMRWIGIIISFPRKQVNDFTYDKYKEAQTSPTMYGDTGATWDINPQYDPDHPLFKNFEWVTIPDLNVHVPKPFVEEFLKNPTDCKTKYMCQPPPQLGGFFEIPHLLDDCVDRDLPGIVSTQQVVTRIVREMEFSYVSRIIDQMPARQEGCYYTMHGDPGLVSDAFSICVCHTLPEAKTIVDSNGDDVELRRVVVDFVLNWEPTSTTPVDLRNVEDVMETLARYYGIQRITFDRWNSATSIQNLIEKGFFAEDMSFSNAMQMQIFRNLKLLVHNSFITWPDNPDLLDELKFLKLENNKITHDAFGKDRADALAGAVWSATGEELSDTQKLVMETLGEISKDRNANGGVATIAWKF